MTPFKGTKGTVMEGGFRAPAIIRWPGKVKAGKSTLLNALVGDELAPTDAGECTRIVTWYRHGLTYRALLTPSGAEPVPVPFHRDAGALEIDLQGRDPDEIDRLEIQWPTPELTELTPVDTPGLGSIASEISAVLGQEPPFAATAFSTPRR